MHKPIYLDYAATTPVAPEVAKRMAEFLTMDGVFANPASRAHLLGWQAEEAVEIARVQVADLLKADSREIIFTSGATESNNLALKGVVESYRKANVKPAHIVTSAIEHKAVLDTCEWLESQGCEVTYLMPDATGTISAEAVKKALKDNTAIVSVMHVNNELGSINDINAIGCVCRDRGVLFHVDAAQAAGKLPLDMSALPVDVLSLSAHKMYGPKGIGALYVRRSSSVAVSAQMHGGGHERGMRSGTLPTHQIVGLGECAAIAATTLETEQSHIQQLKDQFWAGIQHLPGVAINGTQHNKIAGILNVNFGAVDGEELLLALQGVAVSSGSACTSASVEPSYVLKAIGVARERAYGSLRFSFGRYTAEQDITNAIAIVCNGVKQANATSAFV